MNDFFLQIVFKVSGCVFSTIVSLNAFILIQIDFFTIVFHSLDFTFVFHDIHQHVSGFIVYECDKIFCNVESFCLYFSTHTPLWMTQRRSLARFPPVFGNGILLCSHQFTVHNILASLLHHSQTLQPVCFLPIFQDSVRRQDVHIFYAIHSAKNNGRSPVNDRPVLRLIVCILTSPIADPSFFLLKKSMGNPPHYYFFWRNHETHGLIQISFANESRQTQNFLVAQPWWATFFSTGGLNFYDRQVFKRYF